MTKDRLAQTLKQLIIEDELILKNFSERLTSNFFYVYDTIAYTKGRIDAFKKILDVLEKIGKKVR